MSLSGAIIHVHKKNIVYAHVSCSVSKVGGAAHA